MCICHVLFYTYVNVTFVFINIYVYIIFFYNFFTSKNCLCFLSELQLKQQMCLDRRTSSNCRYITTPLPHFLRWGGGVESALFKHRWVERGRGEGTPQKGRKQPLEWSILFHFGSYFKHILSLFTYFSALFSTTTKTFSLINILLFFMRWNPIFIYLFMF